MRECAARHPADPRRRVRRGARALLGDWSDVAAPRIACGMIGSRQGWVEAPYVDCPAGLRRPRAVACDARRTARSRSSPASRCRDAEGDSRRDARRGDADRRRAGRRRRARRSRCCRARTASGRSCAGGRIDAVRDVHDRRALRGPDGAQHPRPHDGRPKARRPATTDSGAACAPRAVPDAAPARCCTGSSARARWRSPASSLPARSRDWLSGLLIGREIGAGARMGAAARRRGGSRVR